jgi:DNA helicase-2/ATP-dependent DNA helicase PcrA
MTYPERRLNAGYYEALQRPSRFLMEVPENLLEAWEISTAKPASGDPF